MINKLHKKIRGFTLIETLMAVLLLSLAIAGPLTIASNSLQATLTAKDQDTAFYLAQDGMEYVRWVRDTNTLQCYANNDCTPSSWLLGLNGTNAGWSTGSPTIDGSNGDCVSSTGAQHCTIDSYANTIDSCGASGASCPVLNYQWVNLSGSTVNYFSHFTYSATNGASITSSVFTRTITIQTPVGTNSSEASTTVTVTWCDQAKVCGGTPRSVTLHEELFNWQ
jgi:prepilin-type N-terminal cleavage/methylation domain-containing protein